MVPNSSAPLMARPTTGAERVRRALLLLSDQHGPNIEVTGDTLAALAYYSRENTSREVARLCRTGAIRRDGNRRLTVLDREALGA